MTHHCEHILDDGQYMQRHSHAAINDLMDTTVQYQSALHSHVSLHILYAFKCRFDTICHIQCWEIAPPPENTHKIRNNNNKPTIKFLHFCHAEQEPQFIMTLVLRGRFQYSIPSSQTVLTRNQNCESSSYGRLEWSPRQIVIWL